MKKIIFIFFLSFLLLSECKKYPEDDFPIHLKTANQRLTGKQWDANLPIRKSTGEAIPIGPWSLNFLSNGEFLGGIYAGFSPVLCSSTGKYKWELIDHKKKLRIYSDCYEAIYTIKKLDRNDLEFEDDSIYHIYHKHINP